MAELRSKRKNSDENFEPILKKRKNRKKSSSTTFEEKIKSK